MSLQLAPMTTWRPMVQYGPTEVPSPITAPSSTRAVGSIVLIKWFGTGLFAFKQMYLILQWLARSSGTVQ